MLGLACLLALLAVPTAVAAPIGSLSAAQCIDDAVSGDEAACSPAPGVSDLQSGAVSADGRLLVVTSDNDATLVAFTRNRSTGRLKFAQCFQDDTAAPVIAACTGVSLLDEPRGVAISPDGRSVYVASFGDKSIVRFNRSLPSGELSPAQCISDNDSPQPLGCTDADGLEGAYSVAVAPDGRSVFVGSASNSPTGDNGVVRFRRNPISGALAFAQCIDDGDAGTEAGCADADGLAGVRALVPSPDGRAVFTASFTDDAVARFIRNRSTGAISYDRCIDDDEAGDPGSCTGVNGLNGVAWIAVSPDSRSLYTSARGDDAAVHLSPGNLAFRGCVDSDVEGTEAACAPRPHLRSPGGPAVSPDGLSLYLPSSNDHAINWFRRNPRTGAIGAQRCIDDADAGLSASCPGVDDLGNAREAVTSADGRSLYVLAGESIVGFNRVGLRCLGRRATHVGTVFGDRIAGTAGPDVIATQAGRDRIFGRGGADRICAGGGPDVARGGAGNDRINGQKGFDRLFGQAGNDLLIGGPGRDRCFGGPGRDRLRSC